MLRLYGLEVGRRLWLKSMRLLEYDLYCGQHRKQWVCESSLLASYNSSVDNYVICDFGNKIACL